MEWWAGTERIAQVVFALRTATREDSSVKKKFVLRCEEKIFIDHRFRPSGGVFQAVGASIQNFP